jgi:DNA-binding XRE family transcriptional regulator
MSAARRSVHAHGRSEIWERQDLSRAIRVEREHLGKRLRKFRNDRGLSQEEAAELAALHPKHLARVERGTANVTIATLVAISKAYGVRLKLLF